MDTRTARRLALCAAGLLRPEWLSLPRTGTGAGARARKSALEFVRHFGYLQLDTIGIAGARSHALVLLSRLPRIAPSLPEELLRQGQPIFEYWGHEASWLPIELYPHFRTRREGFSKSAWWKQAMKGRKKLARELLKRIENDGPVRSADLEGSGAGSWYGSKPVKIVLVALWSSGEIAIRERRSFQRTFDLADRVIPKQWRDVRLSREDAYRELMRRALSGHGWARTGTLAKTWRMRNLAKFLEARLEELSTTGEIVPCDLVGDPQGTNRLERTRGWVLREHFELAERLRRMRPNLEDVRLLSPFDPVLWDRSRVARLFGFDQILEIFKPAAQRTYGYYCLPVLAGDRLIGRVDLRADRKAGTLELLNRHTEEVGGLSMGATRSLVDRAVRDHAERLSLCL